MMDEIRAYLLRIIVVAILCSIVSSLCTTSKLSALVRMLLGIVMAITVLGAALNMDTSRFTMALEAITVDGNDVISQGSKAAQSVISDFVSEETARCIENKALQLGADVSALVEVIDSIPVAVTVVGDVLPYARSQLSGWIAAELGIKREAQKWN